MIRSVLLAVLISISSLSFSQITRIGNVVSWNKVEGNGIYYRMWQKRCVFNKYENKVIVNECKFFKKDTMLLIENTDLAQGGWYEYRVQAIDSLGTKSGYSDPVFVGKDTTFTIYQKYNKVDVYDTVIKIVYQYLYDTIVKYDTVIKTKYNIVYNKTYDTVKFEYPIDTLTYEYTNIIDISVSGVGYRVEYFDLLGRVLDKNIMLNDVFIIVVFDENNRIISSRKCKKLAP